MHIAGECDVSGWTLSWKHPRWGGRNGEEESPEKEEMNIEIPELCPSKLSVASQVCLRPKFFHFLNGEIE